MPLKIHKFVPLAQVIRLIDLKWIRKLFEDKISLQTKIRILEATVMTVVKYGSEAWALQKVGLY